MEIEDRVCSFELSKKLKETGISQESLFNWLEGSVVYGHFGDFADKGNDYISAFTVAELLDLLPRVIDTKKNEPFNNYRFRMEKFLALTDLENNKFEINYLMNYFCDTAEYHEMIRRPLASGIYDTNPANACAKMLIFLKENEFI